MPTELIVMLLVVALVAGWVDAVVGGGGLVQLPALLLAMPSAPPTAVLATDKLSSIAGTTASAAAFARRLRVDARLAVPAGLLAIALSAAGAVAASRVPASAFRPLVMATLLAVALLVVLRPRLGLRKRPLPRSAAATVSAVVLAGVVLPFYNGLAGPGTGALILMVLTGLRGLDFLTSSATAKIINVGANLGALITYALHGEVFWLLGLGMAVCNTLGARLGTRTALRRGAGFIRATLLCVIAALTVKLSVDYLA
ncbi:sulfite exporter TauE/SafE family protein [Bailinhaonella thermotolerans]|uniref:Probable membrane transporter protein n=1 Tax=Bailinhaonella thermotolerans TaxID=1070861 RepID=A0A3A4B362_9ACTN|nr:TSUP family transporter [Bailinhaonella thermotolerans]RJL36155.1 sulfite exporter TauE/SafE family protein [Bailinhaonella thermotolerans]